MINFLSAQTLCGYVLLAFSVRTEKFHVHMMRKSVVFVDRRNASIHGKFMYEYDHSLGMEGYAVRCDEK